MVIIANGKLSRMNNILFLGLTFLSISKSFGSSNLECWYQLNTIDSLLTIGELEKGLELYEDIGSCKEILSNTRHYGMSQLFLSVGKKEMAKLELFEAIKKGVIWSATHQNKMLEFHVFCRKLGGSKFQEDVWALHLSQTNKRLDENEKMFLILREIEKQDQMQREKHNIIDEYIYESTSYENYEDDPRYISELQEFRKKNKLVFDSYYSLIDSLGYVPSDKEAFGQSSMQVLINHSSAYPTSVNVDSIYRYSLEIGTISPKAYANYIGYAAEKQGIEDPYKYTLLSEYYENLSAEQKETINKSRTKIGLPLLPLNMWRMYGIE